MQQLSTHTYARRAKNFHVGNQARRILEAFSTFVYREGLEYLFYQDLISIEDAELYNTYYRTVFSRFVVNDESHLQGRIRSLTNVNSLFPFISPQERQRAVRDAICLLYLIIPSHILSLFEKHERPSRKATIEGWLKDIRRSAPRKEVNA